MIPSLILILFVFPLIKASANFENEDISLRRNLSINKDNPGYISISGTKRTQTEFEISSDSKKIKVFTLDMAEIYDIESEDSIRSYLSDSDDSIMPLKPISIPKNSNFPSCFKGTTPRPSRSVSFDTEAISFNVNEGSESEIRFFEAIFRRNFDFASNMRQQGLVLSNSNTVFCKIMGILKNSKTSEAFIKFFFQYFPYIFSQKYEFGSIYEGISQNNASYILKKYKLARGVQFEIFKEALRNPELKLEGMFNYAAMNFDVIQEMIQLADGAGRKEFIAQIIIKSKFSKYSESSLLIYAINNMKLDQIELILNRSDAINLIMFKPGNGLYENCNAIDLAVRMYDEGLDESYSVMLALFKILGKIDTFNDIEIVKSLLDEFTSNCIEADSNQVILQAFTEGLNRLYECEKTYRKNQELLTHIFKKFSELSDKELSEVETVVDDDEFT